PRIDEGLHADDREGVLLDQQKDHAVFGHDPLRRDLRRHDRARKNKGEEEGKRGDQPSMVLKRARTRRNRSGYTAGKQVHFHCISFCPVGPDGSIIAPGAGGCCGSGSKVPRLLTSSIKYFLATRVTSAAVTFRMFSMKWVTYGCPAPTLSAVPICIARKKFESAPIRNSASIWFLAFSSSRSETGSV